MFTKRTEAGQGASASTAWRAEPCPPGLVTASLVLAGTSWVVNASEDSEQCLGRPPLGAVGGDGLRAPQLAPPAPLRTLLSIPLSVASQEPRRPFPAGFFSPWQTLRSSAPHIVQRVVPSAGIVACRGR